MLTPFYHSLVDTGSYIRDNSYWQRYIALLNLGDLMEASTKAGGAADDGDGEPTAPLEVVVAAADDDEDE